MVRGVRGVVHELAVFRHVHGFGIVLLAEGVDLVLLVLMLLL